MPNTKIKFEALHVHSPEATIHKKHGVHKFSKILQATSKFQGLEGWYKTCPIVSTCNSGLNCEPVIWCFLLGACELICVIVCKRNSIVMLTLSGTTSKFSHLEFVHPWHKAYTRYVWQTQNLKYIQLFGPVNNEAPCNCTHGSLKLALLNHLD